MTTAVVQLTSASLLSVFQIDGVEQSWDIFMKECKHVDIVVKLTLHP